MRRLLVILAIVVVALASFSTILVISPQILAGPEPTSMVPSSGYVSVSNSSLGLTFSLQFHSDGGALTVKADEYNNLSSSNNQSADKWRFDPMGLNPAGNCYSNEPVGFAILQGNYVASNATLNRALYLYNTTFFTSCTVNTHPFVYIFKPVSDRVSVYLDGQPYSNGTASISASVDGFWTGGEGSRGPATLNQFPAGAYTIVGADEWGNVLILHFTVKG